MSFFSRVLGGNTPAQQQSGADTIAKLCDRVQSSTLLDDRRDAVRALKALSKKFRLDVGTQAMELLVHVLETDRSDAEIIGYALDTLHNILSLHPEEEESTEELPNGDGRDAEEMQLAAQFAEIFIKNPNNVPLVLSLLEDYEFRVRWPAIRLLTALLSHQAGQVQQYVLGSPMGVSKMMDLLSDSREVIRNDGLLLLIQLTKGNANIQKIVAFENAFERLLEIMAEEGGSDGGIVVEDCLLLLINLLKKNSSNQSFFKEGGLIQRLTPFFNIQKSEGQDASWSAQKVNNIHLMLQIVRILVSPSNPAQATGACQKVVHQCGLLKLLCDVLMASGVPADILTETINAVSEVIRGCRVNQDFFAAVNAPSTPPRPAIVVLLMSMVNEKQPFFLRCAVLYCFQCFLYKNEIGQEQIISTLLPATADVSAVTAGQLLCGGLFSQDPLSNWCAAIALAHALKDNPTQKEQLLRVQLATGLGNPPVSLLQQCTNLLSQPSVKFQTRLGLLILLSSWMAQSSLAVSHFLGSPGNVPFLTAQVAENADEQEALVQGLCAFLLGICTQFNDNSNNSFTKESLQQIIAKRIGVESFIEKLEVVSKHESYTLAAQKPQLRFDAPEKVLFDYEFTTLFKQLESTVIKAIEAGDDVDAKKTVEDHNSIVTQYKDIIRDQDNQLGELRKKHEELTREYKRAEAQLSEQSCQIQQLRDQYIVLKAQHGTQGGQGEGAEGVENQAPLDGESSQAAVDLQRQVETLTQQLQDKDRELEKVRNDLTIADAKAVLGSEETSQDSQSGMQSQLARQTAELEDLRRSVTQQSELAEKYRLQNEELNKLLQQQQQQGGSANDNSALLAEKAAMSTRMTELEMRLAKTEGDKEKLASDNRELSVAKETLESQLREASAKAANPEIAIALQRVQQEKDELSVEVKRLKGEMERVQKEQEDLLVLLTETDEKKSSYKQRLKDLQQEVSDNELDAAEDDDDDDEDYEDDEEEEGEA
ncbi:general vesicular transport factor p115-like [Diadema antillarum]|uniref:general vesicular transport factor p115-like n=1 Tax=Diadema antillarum TaxID=105358 RepID=UPI003A8628B0